MKAILAALATATSMTAIVFAAPASAAGQCGPGALTVTSSPLQPGLGHRAVRLDFALQSGSCRLSGYPTVDAEAQVEGADPVHAEQTPRGYLGGAVPGTTVTITPGHGAYAMLEWIGSAPVPDCSTYPGPRTAINLRVTPPGMSQTYTVPITVGRNEGVCRLEVHPLTSDTT
jgi:hypothetical protein